MTGPVRRVRSVLVTLSIGIEGPSMSGSGSRMYGASVDVNREEVAVTAMSIRGLDGHVKDQIKIRAAHHGRSMEAEVRQILTEAVAEPEPETDLITELRKAALTIGGVDLDIPARSEMPKVPHLPL